MKPKMSVTVKKEELQPSSSEPKSAEITIGSHYALQVALQTMKERCQQLQQRLAVVEGENLSLKVEVEKCHSLSSGKNNDGNSKCTSNDHPSKGDIEDLQQQVTQLSRQKSQLTHHIFMVTNENKQLWNRLSRLTQANQSLGSHLTKISDTLNQHPAGYCGLLKSVTSPSLGSSESEQIISKDRSSSEVNGDVSSCKDSRETVQKDSLGSTETKEESLEEISLKLIKSFLQEKNELEQQCAQMVQIQTDCPSFSVPDLGFMYDEENYESIVDDVKQHGEQLQSMLESLKLQRNGLKDAVCKLDLMKNGGLMCSHCVERSKSSTPAEKTTQAEVVELESLRTWGAAGNLSYSADIQRQLKQVAEPPGSAPTNRRSSSTAPKRISERSSSFTTTTTTSMPTWRGSATEQPVPDEWMCPLCSKLFPKISKSFEEFHHHVMSHFASEDDADSITDNFEIIPNDL
ncbi:paramyosin [Anabrus simplex]|uniref:paramyosin n=1 Tax=Anabrus simplex TaxID=316456 RepID=UPI0035A2FE03